MAGYAYNDPDLQYRLTIQRGDQQRKQAAADAQNQSRMAMQDEANRNKLLAQKYALDNSQQMQGHSGNPRTVTDTSMTIGNGGGSGFGGGSGSASRRSPSGGGFGSANPQIDGRYMSLVNFQAPTLNQNMPARVSRQQADFTPGDATAYQSAAFGRAKATAGGLGKSAIDSLVSQLAGRGISSSGTTGRGIAGEIVKSVDPLSELNVAHLGQEYSAVQRARELSEASANNIYQGDLTQRGQDISGQNAMNNLLTQIAQLKYQGEVQQTEGGLNRQLQLQRLYEML